MDLLKRSYAPVLPEAWEAIDDEARNVLGASLAGRKLVDFSGPHGWELAAVNTGRLEPLEKAPVDGVKLARRSVRSLVEVRVPFTLAVENLDRVGRGGEPDLEAVVDAARRAALTEDAAIFNSLETADMAGIIGASPHTPLEVEDASDYPRALLEATELLRKAGVNGPYAVALGSAAYDELFSKSDDGYPIIKQVRPLIAGPIVRAEAVAEAVVISMRGGDYELIVGQDLAIGFAGQSGDKLSFFVTESFAFRVLDEGAAVPITRKS